MKQDIHAGAGGITWTQWVTGEEQKVKEKDGVKQGECERKLGQKWRDKREWVWCKYITSIYAITKELKILKIHTYLNNYPPILE